MRVLDAKLNIAASAPDLFPESTLPEVAFAGRSNVGKSSLVSALLGRKGRRLVRISRKPGKTRTVCFFDVRAEEGPVRFVDLPGYGYASASKQEKKRWGPLITEYLEHRASLCLVLVLLDPRHEPTRQDAEVFELLSHYERPTVVAATKMDKLSKSKKKPAALHLSQTTGTRVLPCSATTGEGLESVLHVIGRACGIV